MYANTNFLDYNIQNMGICCIKQVSVGLIFIHVFIPG